MLEQESTRAKVKRSYVLETILGLSLISVVNFFFFRSLPGFVGVRPHPYWIVIILISARYGFRGGLLSGALSGVLYAGFWVLGAGAGAGLSLTGLRSLSLWGHPLLFLTAGVILGEIRQSQIRVADELATRVRALEKDKERLLEQYNALARVKQEIDTRIISQEQTLSTLYEAAQALRSLNETEIYPSVLDLLKDYISVEQCSIFLLEDDKLVLKGYMGPPDSKPPETADRHKGLIGRALAAKRTVSLQGVLEDKSLEKDGLIVAPVTTVDQHKIMGLIRVERMPFMKFNQDSIKMVSLIADWCGASLENAMLFEDTKAKLIADEIVDAYTPEYLRQRLAEEFARSRRYAMPLSLLALEFPNFEDISAKDAEDVLLTFSVVLKNWTRDIDLLFLYKTGVFVLLLPNTPKEGARVVAKNITTTFDSLSVVMKEQDKSLVGIRAGVSSLLEGMKDSDEMLNAALEDMRSVRYTA